MEYFIEAKVYSIARGARKRHTCNPTGTVRALSPISLTKLDPVPFVVIQRGIHRVLPRDSLMDWRSLCPLEVSKHDCSWLVLAMPGTYKTSSAIYTDRQIKSTSIKGEPSIDRDQ